jgi:putative NADPH-quinone reductase
MKEYYLAVTYDVCEHNHLYVDMNEYPLDMSIDFDEQISKFAKMDVAPLVKVYESDSSDFEELRLYKEYKFKEYECGCNQ